MNKQTLTLIFFSFIFLFSCNSPSTKPTILESNDGCTKIYSRITYNNEVLNLINLDNVDATKIKLEIQKNNSGSCYDYCNDYFIDFYYGGEKISNTLFADKLEYGLTVTLDPRRITRIDSFLDHKTERSITAILQRKCSFITKEEIAIAVPIQIVKNGETYIFTTESVNVMPRPCPPTFDSYNLPSDFLCCDTNEIKMIELSNDEEGLRLQFTSKGSTKLGLVTAHHFGENVKKISPPDGGTYTWKGALDSCTFFCIRDIYDVTYRTKYKVDSDNDNKNDVVISPTIKEEKYKGSDLGGRCRYPCLKKNK